MNNEIFFNWVSGAGSFFYLPLFIWIAYFFLCRSWDYPAELERYIRSGKYWPYLPIYWKGRKKPIRGLSFLLFWAGNVFSACALYYLFPYKNVMFMVIGMAISVFVELQIRSYAVKEIVRLQQDRHFQIYTHLMNMAVSKGVEVSDSELLSRAQWQHHNDLRIADKQGRLLQFLRGEAKL